MLKIGEDKWLEWGATFNAHTSLSELWRKVRIATGKLPGASAHPQLLQEANRMAEHFAERSSSAQLPLEIRPHLQQVQLERVAVPVTQLQIQGIVLQWVNVYKYLGIWIDKGLKFDNEINYLRDRMGKRINMMRAMTGPKVGAGHVVLRTLYIHAIRSLTDYATLALDILSEWQWVKLEVAQNNAMSHCQVTCVDKLKTYTWRQVSHLSKPGARESDIKNGLLRALNLNRDVFSKKTWLLCAADAVNQLELKDTILSKGPDAMSPDYSTPAPWDSPPAVFNILQTGTRKADCNPHELRQVAERNMK
ncbi:hypothetical protein Hamer_G005896, partial [Homarus americanus]